MIDLMARRPGATNQIQEEIATFIGRYKREDILRVAVDGVDGVGKTTLATSSGAPSSGSADLSSGHQSTASITRANSNTDAAEPLPEGFYLDSYDYAALRIHLLDPLRPGGSGVYCSAIFDHVSDSRVPLQMRVASPGAALIPDGLFLHRQELRDTWDFSIFPDAPFEVTIPRGAVRGPGWGGFA
jgi:uridine kinase